MAVPPTSLNAGDTSPSESQLPANPDLLGRHNPGGARPRPPPHTGFVPADRFTPSLAADWGAQALALAEAHGGLVRLGHLLGQERALAAAVAARVEAKLSSEPIEDLRLDFED